MSVVCTGKTITEWQHVWWLLIEYRLYQKNWKHEQWTSIKQNTNELDNCKTWLKTHKDNTSIHFQMFVHSPIMKVREAQASPPPSNILWLIQKDWSVSRQREYLISPETSVLVVSSCKDVLNCTSWGNQKTLSLPTLHNGAHCSYL